MKLRQLLVSVAAACLLVGASNTMACCTNVYEAWLLIGVDTAHGEFQTEARKCSVAIQEVKLLGYRFGGMSQVKENVNVLYFQQRPFQGDGSISLFCYALINQFDEDSPL